MRMKYLLVVLTVATAIATAQQSADTGVRSELVHTRTDDGIMLDGAFWSPTKGQPAAGIALVTGGTRSEFYALGSWAERFANAGYLALAMNQRDHGTEYAYQKFEPTCRDLKYAVDLLQKHGVKTILLLGHSFGTEVVSYYLTTGDSRISGAILLSPHGDPRIASERLLGSKEAYDGAVAKARQMVADGHGKALFIPGESLSSRYGPRQVVYTYEVFLDKRGPDTKALPPELLKGVKLPILAVRDPADPFPATLPPMQESLERATKSLKFVLLPDKHQGKLDPSAHSFIGRESEVLGIMLNWSREHGFVP